MHLKHGAVLQGGKYRIVKVLGAGSFGVTYLAKTKVVGNFGAIETSVAIKEFFASELNTRLADGSVREMSGNSLASKYMKKFAEEADKISLLKEHPGIVKVLETFSENNTCYYVMEYKDGGSLREYVDGNGGVPESEAIEMIRKIGDALSYMHSRKMLHLDLKPGNVMMDSDGSLCLIDFGLSRHFENEESESTTGIGLGTVGYAPIEQAGYNSADARKDLPVTLDVYALGATLYKMLTGKTPPPSYELLQSFPSAALEAKGVSAKTIEAIKKAMSPIPSFRPQTVAEFLLMLDKDYKPSVPSVAEEEKTEIFLDPEPSQDPETINEDSHEGDKTQVQHKEEKPKKKYRRWLWWLLAAVILVGVGVFAVMSSKSEGKATVASAASTTGTYIGHEWVDLGLSVKWATCNVGAYTPGDYGNYYAWGETSTKSHYDNSASYGKSWSYIGGNSSRDAATANWGGSWRMPTKAEFQELKDNCTWTWTTQNGKNGYKVTGPNGQSIFLPAAGFGYGSSIGNVGEDGYYWSSTAGESYTGSACLLWFIGNNVMVDWSDRNEGYSVRPVLED